MLGIGRRGLSIASLAALAAVAGTTQAGAATTRAKAFGSCDELAEYAAKNNASKVRSGRFVSMAPDVSTPKPVGTPEPRPMPTAPTSTAPVAPGQPQESADAPAGAIAPATGVQAPVFSGESNEHSTTNVQEAGVDEPDIVKSDGARLFAIANKRLYALDVSTGTPALLDSVALDGTGHRLLVAGDKLLVIAQSETSFAPVAEQAEAVVQSTALTEFNISDRSQLRVVARSQIEGDYVSARLVEGTVRLVINSRPQPLAPVAAGQASTSSRIARWLPSYAAVRRGKQRPSHWLVRCGAVRRASEFSGLDVLSVSTIDLDKGLAPVDSDAIMADAEIVYSSRNRMYFASERWLDADYADQDSARTTTTLHEFSIDGPSGMTYRGSGTVRGALLNQFSLSERGGKLRVASTDLPAWISDDTGESFVTVLSKREGGLAEVGRVGGIGRGEDVRAVRFFDDSAFVVTFRQTDPLYAIDLSRPSAPRVSGELKLFGYSAYLHPAGNDLLIGVGQDATASGWELGAQVSLFDIGDLSRPVRLASRKLPANSYSAVEGDHHAFLYWPPSKLAMIPIRSWSGDGQFGGAIGLRISRGGGVSEVGKVSHDDARGTGDPTVMRSLVAGGRLLTLSRRGVESSSLETLAGLAFTPFDSREH